MTTRRGFFKYLGLGAAAPVAAVVGKGISELEAPAALATKTVAPITVEKRAQEYQHNYYDMSCGTAVYYEPRSAVWKDNKECKYCGRLQREDVYGNCMSCGAPVR